MYLLMCQYVRISKYYECSNTHVINVTIHIIYSIPTYVAACLYSYNEVFMTQVRTLVILVGSVISVLWSQLAAIHSLHNLKCQSIKVLWFL